MRRYFYSGTLDLATEALIQGDLFHHIFDVCRLDQGQHFELMTEGGSAYLVEVQSVEKKQARVLVQEVRSILPLKHPHLYLYLSFPKVATFESIVEKSVEMGVKSIVPVLSDFSFIRKETQFPQNKRARWDKIILQATQQSGRGDFMTVQPPQKLDHELLLELKSPQTLNVVAYEGQTQQGLRAFLSEKKEKTAIERINLLVGSEGGFSDSEITLFKELDFVPVTLGDQILRVETACMTLVACLKYEFNLLE